MEPRRQPTKSRVFTGRLALALANEKKTMVRDLCNYQNESRIYLALRAILGACSAWVRHVLLRNSFVHLQFI